MKKINILGDVIFWIALISPLLSFSLVNLIGEVNIFGAAGMVRYSWIMLLFVPIGISSIIIAFKLKSSKQKYKKNFIIACICLPLLIIFGSYRFIFNNTVSYDFNEVSVFEDKIGFDFPDEIKIATVKLDSYGISYAKIEGNTKEMFEQEIQNNQLWQEELNYEIKGVLPLDIQYESDTFEYFLFFNITSDEYNTPPKKGQYECLFLAYDCDLQKLIILNDYKICI